MTRRPSAAMPLAYPFGEGQPLGWSICGALAEASPSASGSTATVGLFDVLTTLLHHLRAIHSAATLGDPACAICRRVNRFSLPVCVLGSCSTNSIARGSL